jgi:hypothetical protein
MTKFQLLAAAAVAALGAACAGSGATDSASSSTTTTTTTTRSAQATAPAPATTATPAPAQQAQTTTTTTTTPAAPTTFTDAQLRSFAAAATEIDPISRSVATQTPEQRAASTEQIRQILARNNLDSATYNAIAARAQADPALASRIASLNRPNQAPG